VGTVVVVVGVVVVAVLVTVVVGPVTVVVGPVTVVVVAGLVTVVVDPVAVVVSVNVRAVAVAHCVLLAPAIVPMLRLFPAIICSGTEAVAHAVTSLEGSASPALAPDSTVVFAAK
jgi:hypothetical protein